MFYGLEVARRPHRRPARLPMRKRAHIENTYWKIFMLLFTRTGIRRANTRRVVHFMEVFIRNTIHTQYRLRKFEYPIIYHLAR